MVRKGRFDEIFFVDLPSVEEREVIFRIHVEKRGRKFKNEEYRTLSVSTNGFSGAEIEECVISGLYEAFDNKRELTHKDVLKAIKETKPLSVTMKEDVQKLRDWADGRARKASVSEVDEEDTCKKRAVECN
jgi:SpoVK/Ycf46/Vps4 family AAA+-type ATPase